MSIGCDMETFRVSIPFVVRAVTISSYKIPLFFDRHTVIEVANTQALILDRTHSLNLGTQSSPIVRTYGHRSNFTRELKFSQRCSFEKTCWNEILLNKGLRRRFHVRYYFLSFSLSCLSILFVLNGRTAVWESAHNLWQNYLHAGAYKRRFLAYRISQDHFEIPYKPKIKLQKVRYLVATVICAFSVKIRIRVKFLFQFGGHFGRK